MGDAHLIKGLDHEVHNIKPLLWNIFETSLGSNGILLGQDVQCTMYIWPEELSDNGMISIEHMMSMMKIAEKPIENAHK